MGGLSAAAALARRGVSVVVVETDTLPEGARTRSGVPQSEQLHNLLTRAQVSLEQLLPGFREALEIAGAGSARVADETHVYELGVRMPARDLGLRLMCAPRPLIEFTARTLLMNQHPGVRVMDRTRVTGVMVDGGVLHGVRTDAGALEADVVVDASGSPSPAPQWLEAAGCAAPEAETTAVSQWYVSTRFRRPERWRGRDDFWLVFPTPPRTLGGLVSPAGADEWYVSVSGRAGDPRPSSVEEVRTHAHALEDPWIADLLETAEPVSAPRLFHKATARRRRYELLDAPLPGFLPIGDAFASLNPLFGQGVSVAAQQAVILAEALAEHNDANTFTRTYLQQAAAAAERAISLGEAVDAVLPDPNAFAAKLTEDAELHALYVRVWHLLEPASALARYSTS
jgi:flavin-dependent dehydrogenase